MYQKDNREHVSEELFANPPAICRGTPFWAWNCTVTEEMCEKQIGHFKEMGMGGFHMHCRTGMSTEYLSDAFMGHIKKCNELAREKGMLSWLYDEDRYASGYGGGYVTKDPAFRQRSLVLLPYLPEGVYEPDRRTFEAKLERGETVKGYFLCCYHIVLENGCLKQAEHSFRMDAFEHIEDREEIWFACLELDDETSWWNNQTYVNTLDKKAIDRFLSITHERYAECLGDEFGRSVPAIFTDEPQHVRFDYLNFPDERRKIALPFTDDFPETFQASCGLDFYRTLPEVIWELPQERISRARYCYHNHLTDRFVEAYAANIGRWCQSHGIGLTGHMKGEETLSSQTAYVGEVMRSLRYFHIPGHDVLCDQRDYATAKMAQSVARQYKRRGALSELYGVTGWAFDFKGHKLQGDWQAALGIVVRVHHLAWMSMRGEAKRDYPASIQYQSPWYREYAALEDYFARINTVLITGDSCVDIGVIHPIESCWLVYGPYGQTFRRREELEQNYRNVTQWLLEEQLDFDFISEALLEEQGDSRIVWKEGKAALVMGQMAYKSVLLPGMTGIRSNTVRVLEQFVRMGGRVFVLGKLPYIVDGVLSQLPGSLVDRVTVIPFERSALTEALEPVRRLEIRTAKGGREDNLFYQMRKNRQGMTYVFLAHGKERLEHSFEDMVESRDYPYVENISVYVKGSFKVREMDAFSGKICSLEAQYLQRENGERWTLILYPLSVHGSLLLEMTPWEAGEDIWGQQAKEFSLKSGTGQPTLKRCAGDLSEPWKVSFEEDNVFLLDMASYRIDEEAWHGEEEILRLDNLLRERFGYPLKEEAGAQPWTSAGEVDERPHMLSLRFAVRTEEAVKAELAMEDPGEAQICVNGIPVEGPGRGYFVDEAIRRIPLPWMKPGENEILLKIPYGAASNIEACYLLGNFRVSCVGRHKEIHKKREGICFGDIGPQGYPFYGGNLTYHCRLQGHGREVLLKAQHFTAPLLKVKIDGREAGIIAFAPYTLSLGVLEEGEHEVELVSYGNRNNTFGPLHNSDPDYNWVGSCAWRTKGDRWTYQYQLKKNGIYCAPHIYEL